MCSWRSFAVARVFALVVRCRIMILFVYSRVGKNRDTERGSPVGAGAGRTAGHLTVLFSQKVLAVRKANCIYRPVMGRFYLFCSIRTAFTASWSSLYHDPVAASTITGTSPIITSNITQPAPTFVFTTLVTDSYPSFLYSIV
jgi:hypothetical protein